MDSGKSAAGKQSKPSHFDAAARGATAKANGVSIIATRDGRDPLLVAGFPDHANLSVSAVVTDFLMIATEAGKI